MGLINQATNVVDRIVDLERGLEAIRKLAGLTSAIISRGGLTLLNDSFIKMISAAGFQIVYIGPGTVSGKQIIEIRRHNGSLVLRTAVYAPTGEQYWAMYDRNSNILVSDDAASGYGLANPWLAVPMIPLFSMAASSVYPYMHLPVSSVTSETDVWLGKIPQLHHGFVGIDGIWGQALNVNSSTYRLKLNGTTVGTWNETGIAAGQRGPFDVHTLLNSQWVDVRLTVQASGAGNVAAHIFAVACRGS